MRDELLTYYERELGFVRRMATEFGDKYPRIAGRLQLERGKCDDPHVERLIEAFALLAARVHLKIDDDFPEITQALLQVLYPHYLRPVPSMSIARFEIDPDQGRLSKGYRIPRHQSLHSRTSSCDFRTAYPVVLWPLTVAEADYEEPGPSDGAGGSPTGVLTLQLRTNGEALF